MQKTILIADDSESCRELLRVILCRGGCNVVEARDGEEALKQALAILPAAVILDLNMPRLDGYAVVALLREAPSFVSIPIIALSAAASLTDETRLTRAGFTAFLDKPIAPAKLRTCISKLLDIHGPACDSRHNPA